jgi:hypothetical protein
MQHVTPPDVVWLGKLVQIVDAIYEDYPELFNTEDEETIAITRELIRSLG